MLDNDIIVLLLVIIPSILTYYLSQGSVSVMLRLVNPCCGIWQNEGQNVFVYPTFYISVLLAYLNSHPGWIHVCLHVLLLTRMHEDMLFYEGGVCDTLEIQVFLRFLRECGVIWIRSIWPTLYFTKPYCKLGIIYGTSMCRVYLWISKESDSTLSGSTWPICSIRGEIRLY